jgi:uncharacterized membrane protein
MADDSTLAVRVSVRYAAPTSYPQFVNQVLASPEGMKLIIWGNLLGFAFAVVVLSISVVSFNYFWTEMSVWELRSIPRSSRLH